MPEIGETSDAQPRQATQRMRATRKRREGFVGMIRLPVHRSEVATPVQHRFLAEHEQHDLVAIGDALGALLDHVLHARPDDR